MISFKSSTIKRNNLFSCPGCGKHYCINDMALYHPRPKVMEAQQVFCAKCGASFIVETSCSFRAAVYPMGGADGDIEHKEQVEDFKDLF